MIKLIRESNYDSYKDYWAYKDVSKNWESDVEIYKDSNFEPTGAKVIIWYDKDANDKYAEFRIERDEEFGDWFVYEETDTGKKGGRMINDLLDYTDNLEACIKGCFYYFNTRY